MARSSRGSLDADYSASSALRSHSPALMYDQPASCFRISSATPESTCDAKGNRSSVVTLRMRIEFWHASSTTPLAIAFFMRSSNAALVRSGADAGESTHPMQVRRVFRQILPVRFKLGVHVGEMKEADVLRRRRRLQDGMQSGYRQ